MNAAVLIPAYQPDEKLVRLVDELLEKDVPHIVIIDDGSTDKEVFNRLLSRERCQVVQHRINLGKGSAIKTGIKAILDSQMKCPGIVTADADGQHLVRDIIRVAEEFEARDDVLVLGCRDFSKEMVPKRSRFGNKITRFLFKLCSGAAISDTQTGLRAFSLMDAGEFLKIDGERYEFEMNMLFEAAKRGTEIEEVKIETIYIDQNRASHFKPLKDSLRVYKRFIKYGISSVSSFLLDILFFALFSRLFKIYGALNFILFATICARAISSVFNFACNKRLVFGNRDKSIKIFVKYYILCGFQMLASAFLVRLIYETGFGLTVLIKVIVDVFLAFISYFIQKRIVFKRLDGNMSRYKTI